jgi:uncharacterized protein (TIGR03435 family)
MPPPAKTALRAAAALACLAAPLLIGRAQSNTAHREVFAAISIKPDDSPPPWRIGMDFHPGGRIHANSATLALLIGHAYDVPFNSSRIIGLPDWAIRTLYTIDAVPEEAIPPGLSTKALRARVRPMLQAMLADRFQLVIRRDTQELPVYAITLRKGGPKLKPAAIQEKDCTAESLSDCHNLHGGPTGISGSAVDLDDLARFTSNWTDRPVVNRTGLTGLYQVETEHWGPMTLGAGRNGRNPSDENPEDPNGPTMVTVFNRLGLNLEPSKAPLDTFLIVHVERPTGN